ncbi:hypothetical protein ACFQ0M_19720 [Kitasatospora aburaviensis]
MTAVQDERSPVRTAPDPAPAPLPDRVKDALGAPVRALREAPRRPLLAVSAVALLSLVVYAVVRHFVHTSMVDMVVYRAEGAAVADGGDLYGLRVTEWNLPATYPRSPRCCSCRRPGSRSRSSGSRSRSATSDCSRC